MIEEEPPKHLPHCRAYLVQNTDIRILVSIDTLANGEEWLHVAVYRAAALPDWETMIRIKNVIIGMEGEAIMFFPKHSEYVNYNPYCLHLWSFISDTGLKLVKH